MSFHYICLKKAYEPNRRTKILTVEDGCMRAGSTSVDNNETAQTQSFLEKDKINCLERIIPVGYKYVGRLLGNSSLCSTGIIASFKDQKGKEAL